MLARLTLRAEVWAGTRGQKLRTPQPHPDAILGRAAYLGHDLVRLGRHQADTAFGEIRLAPRADRIAEVSCDFLGYTHISVPLGRTFESDLEGSLLSTRVLFRSFSSSMIKPCLLFSNVEILDLESMPFDKLPARFDIVAHQGGEQVIGGNRIIKPYLHERAASGVHRGFPELFGIHLA